jgi:hypothetical protein
MMSKTFSTRRLLSVVTIIAILLAAFRYGLTVTIIVHAWQGVPTVGSPAGSYVNVALTWREWTIFQTFHSAQWPRTKVIVFDRCFGEPDQWCNKSWTHATWAP